MDGAHLYGLVETYWAMGNHRAGSKTDQMTAAWIAQQLAGSGLAVESQPVPFECWDAVSALTVDGVAVEHLPVPRQRVLRQRADRQDR